MTLEIKNKIIDIIKKYKVIIYIFIFISFIIILIICGAIRYKYANKTQRIFINNPINIQSYSKTIRFDNIPKSLNKIQCTYSIWLYLENTPENAFRKNGFNSFYPIFEKKTHSTNMGSPGLYYRPKDSKIMVSIKTTNDNEFIVKSIILQKWNNIVIVIEDRNMDIYINGKLYRSFFQNNVIDLGDSDLSISKTNSIYGSISYFRYFNSALNPDTVKYIYNQVNHKLPSKPNLWWLYP